MRAKTVGTGVMAITVSLVLTACGGTEAVAEGPTRWEAELARMHESAENDFVRDALADGEITAAEREEAFERFVTCGAQQGVDLTAEHLQTGFTSLPDETKESWEARKVVFDDCAGMGFGYAGLISLHDQMAQNPEGLYGDALILDCLRRHDLAPDGMTVAELTAIIGPVIGHPLTCEEAQGDPRFSSVECLDGGGVGVVYNPDWVAPPMVLPNGVSLDDGAGAGCLWNPEN